MREIDFLKCPICSSPLEVIGNSYKCNNTLGKSHCFDIASSGYADLSYRNGGGGDPKDAVTDRTLFLDKGYYAPLYEEILNLSKQYKQECSLIIDAGCGECYYSEKLANCRSDSFLIGFDLSKHAVRKASVRRNARGGSNSFYAVSSIFGMPLIDSCADVVLSMFAPIAEHETKRILKHDGILIIGAAAEGHLYELKDAIYDEVYLNESRVDFPKNMMFIDRHNIRYSVRIDNQDDIRRLFGMTPYRFRTSEASYNKLLSLEHLDVTVDVDFYVYRNN
jgi:23S rRNA (guanine745-N1)-methyltransferase